MTPADQHSPATLPGPASPPGPPAFEPPGAARPVRNAAIVLYASLALIAFTIPQSLVNWLRDMNGNPVQETLLRGAEAMQNALATTGITTPYRWARERFIAIAGAEDD